MGDRLVMRKVDDMLTWSSLRLRRVFDSEIDTRLLLAGHSCSTGDPGPEALSEFRAIFDAICWTSRTDAISERKHGHVLATLLTLPTPKIPRFWQSKMAAAAMLKNQKSTYISDGLTDRREIWRSDTLSPFWPSYPWNSHVLKIQDGGGRNLEMTLMMCDCVVYINSDQKEWISVIFPLRTGCCGLLVKWLP